MSDVDRSTLRRRVRTLVLLTALISPLFPASSPAADGRELLAHVGVSAVERNFRGEKMIIDFSRMTPQVRKLTVLHQLGGRERREFESPRSVVIVDGDYFYQYYPDRKLAVRRKLPGDGGFKALRRESLKQTLESYELKNSESEPVAGRRVRLYEFHPRQVGSRPLRKVWVDVETGLVLRMEVYSPDSRLFLLSVYESVDYQLQPDTSITDLKVPDGVKIIEVEERGCLSPQEAERVANLSLGLPRYLPPGFVRKCVRARHTGSYGEIQVLYSDGLSLLSLFTSSAFKASKSPTGRSSAVQVAGVPGVMYRLGLVSAIYWRSPSSHLAILGELSREELFKVAESISVEREITRQ